VKALAALLFLWANALMGALFAFADNPRLRAVMGMALGLLWLWVVGIGGVMYAFRGRISKRLARYGTTARRRFALFAIGAITLACVEEAIACAMTASAPLYGVPVGRAYITATTNYLDLVALHSVVAFVPAMLLWAWATSRQKFAPAWVAIFFGLYGLGGETIAFGPQSLSNAGFWVLVYGAMVYLPAFVVAEAQPNRPLARWWHYPLLMVGGWGAAAPVAVVLSRVHAVQHFPPL
jgi:cbb3-type cytochrome oxidase subunit 3